MPCFGGKILDLTFMSFIKWGHKSIELDISWAVECVSNESLITRARNISVASFLKSPAKFTHLMFIDALLLQYLHRCAFIKVEQGFVSFLLRPKPVHI